jgi:hypothetical protein
MTDWYETKTARKVGFTARPVVGGVFAQMLYDQKTWAKYAARDRTKVKNWASMPRPPKIFTVLPAADTSPAIWSYTINQPAADWYLPGFKAAGWTEGRSGFGTQGTPNTIVNTVWNAPEIWLRREVELDKRSIRDLQAWVHHDEDVEVFLNGVLVLRLSGYTTGYDAMPLRPAAQSALKPGRNIIAVHCRQTAGGQYIDLGLVRQQVP